MNFITKVKKFFKNAHGAISLEYGIGMALILVASIGALAQFNASVKQSFYCNSPDQQTKNTKICNSSAKNGGENSGQ